MPDVSGLVGCCLKVSDLGGVSLSAPASSRGRNMESSGKPSPGLLDPPPGNRFCMVIPSPAMPTSPKDILPRKPRRVRPFDFSEPSELFITPHC